MFDFFGRKPQHPIRLKVSLMPSPLPQRLASCSSDSCKCVHVSTNLTVEAKQQQHNEEENRPECRKRHHGYSLGVGNESQAWTCRGGGVGGKSRQRGKREGQH